MMFTDKEGPENVRTIHMDGQNDIILNRTDPHGFWRIHFKKGQIPAMLGGMYTSHDEAMKKVELYISTQKRVVISKD